VLAAVDRALTVNDVLPLVWRYWGDIAGEVAVVTSNQELAGRARDAHRRATSLAPGWWRYWQNAGDTDMLLAEFGAAKEHFGRAAGLNQRNWVLWASYGDAANRQGDRDTARLAYERALALQPGGNGEVALRRALEALNAPR